MEGKTVRRVATFLCRRRQPAFPPSCGLY